MDLIYQTTFKGVREYIMTTLNVRAKWTQLWSTYTRKDGYRTDYCLRAWKDHKFSFCLCWSFRRSFLEVTATPGEIIWPLPPLEEKGQTITCSQGLLEDKSSLCERTLIVRVSSVIVALQKSVHSGVCLCSKQNPYNTAYKANMACRLKIPRSAES